MLAKDHPEFDFHCKFYPIIADNDWEVGYISYGSVAFYRRFSVDSRRSWRVGVVRSPGRFSYFWGANTGGSGKGAGLGIATDAPFSEVYAAAEAQAMQYFADEKARIDAAIAMRRSEQN